MSSPPTVTRINPLLTKPMKYSLTPIASCLMLLARPALAAKAAQFDKKKPILVNCHLGSRGDIAAVELARMGFKNVFNLEGGLDAGRRLAITR